MRGPTRKLHTKIITALHQEGTLTYTQLKHTTQLNDASLSRNLRHLLDEGQISVLPKGRHKYYRLTRVKAIKEVREYVSSQIHSLPNMYFDHRTALFVFGKKLPPLTISALPDGEYDTILKEDLPVLPESTTVASPELVVKCLVLSRIYSQTTALERDQIAQLYGVLVWMGYLLSHHEPEGQLNLKGILRNQSPHTRRQFCREGLERAFQELGYTMWQYPTHSLSTMEYQILYEFAEQRDWLTKSKGSLEASLFFIRKTDEKLIQIIYKALAPVNIVYVWSPNMPEAMMYSLFEQELMKDYASWFKVLRQGGLDDRPWIFTEGARDLAKFIRLAENDEYFSQRLEVPNYAIDIDPYTHTNFLFRNHPRGTTIALYQELLNAIDERKILMKKSEKH